MDKQFDGDALGGVIIPETDMVRAFRNLSAASIVYNKNTGDVTSDIGIHKTTAITINSFLGIV